MDLKMVGGPAEPVDVNKAVSTSDRPAASEMVREVTEVVSFLGRPVAVRLRHPRDRSSRTAPHLLGLNLEGAVAGVWGERDAPAVSDWGRPRNRTTTRTNGRWGRGRRDEGD